MDIVLHFWDNSKKQVESVFVNSSTAAYLLKGLTILSVHDIDSTKVLHLSMDGPNVNWKLKQLMQQDRETVPDSPRLLLIGSCVVQVVHGAFRPGTKKTDWNVKFFLRALYNLFQAPPTRRGLFFKITDSEVMPFQFCDTRWIENARVCKRAIQMLPLLHKNVQTVTGTKYESSCNSFATVSKAPKDSLFSGKVSIFHSLAEDFEPFLTEFQTNMPMSPFLYGSLILLVKKCFECIVKEEILNSTKVQCIKVTEMKNDLFVNLKKEKNVDVGYETRAALKTCKYLGERDMLLFKKNVRTCLQHTVAEILERSPLKYPLTKPLQFMNPTYVSSDVEGACSKVTVAFDIVLEAHLKPASKVQNADREYRALVSEKRVINEFKLYSRKEKRLDDFWMQVLPKNEYPNLRNLVKMLLILSHGNATLETGFSVTSEILVENLKEDSLVAQKIVYDSVYSAGGLDSFNEEKSLVHYIRNSHSRYKEAEDDRKKAMTAKDKAAAERRQANMLVRELEAKNRTLQKQSDAEMALIDEELKKLLK